MYAILFTKSGSGITKPTQRVYANIAASCKFVVSNGIDTNTASWGSMDSFSASYVYREVGEFADKSRVKAHTFISKMHICGKGFRIWPYMRLRNGFLG